MTILYDTDFLYNLLVPTQANHAKAQAILQNHHTDDWQILKLVKYELATVLSHKESHALAKQIIHDLDESIAEWRSLSEQEEKEAWRIFDKQKKKGTSFVDCTNLAVAKLNDYRIASFDGFYPKSFLVYL
jgi:predicted nucleic acid-binding protein